MSIDLEKQVSCLQFLSLNCQIGDLIPITRLDQVPQPAGILEFVQVKAGGYFRVSVMSKNYRAKLANLVVLKFRCDATGAWRAREYTAHLDSLYARAAWRTILARHARGPRHHLFSIVAKTADNMCFEITYPNGRYKNYHAVNLDKTWGVQQIEPVCTHPAPRGCIDFLTLLQSAEFISSSLSSLVLMFLPECLRSIVLDYVGVAGYELRGQF
jgi:hypothetical protein